MSITLSCQLSCDEQKLFPDLESIFRSVLRIDGDNCPYLDVRDGSGGGGGGGGTTIVQGVMGGDGSSFQDSGLIGKSQIIVLANGNAVPQGDIDSFDPVTGIIIFDPVLTPGDSIQVIAV